MLHFKPAVTVNVSYFIVESLCHVWERHRCYCWGTYLLLFTVILLVHILPLSVLVGFQEKGIQSVRSHVLKVAKSSLFGLQPDLI